MKLDLIQRFMLDDLDIRGAVVRLGPAWQAIIADRPYPEPVIELLGQMCVTAAFMTDALKQRGRITFQLRGKGPVSLLVVDCCERLNLRAMALTSDIVGAGSPAELLGEGQLLLSLDQPHRRQPWQSVVPIQGQSIADIFEHYLSLSEQSPWRLFLAASPTTAAGLFLQKLPDADLRDEDGWNRIETLAATVDTRELLDLDPEVLLTRLFHEETLRVFPARPVIHESPEDWDKVRTMLRSLGRDEVEAILHEQGEVVIRDDLANREYRFDAAAVAELFDAPAPTLH